MALLTGGGDRPYALGMAASLTARGIELDFIGSDELASPDVLHNPRIRFLNLRGDQGSGASIGTKVSRVLIYYLRLLNYAVRAKPKIFHLLWNNKFQLFDRTALMLLYKITRRKIVLTVHNVNAAVRDGRDTWLNRASLRMQYGLCDHLFVHTPRMKKELRNGFSVAEKKVSVIPFGLNKTVPDTALSSPEARRLLRLGNTDRVLLFFGNIARYKGLEYLISAFGQLARLDTSYRLIIAGRPKHGDDYWKRIRQLIEEIGFQDCIIQRTEYIPDEETEVFFKAADVLVLPYTYVFQSGVLFLGYGFGLPAVATDVGALKEEVIEGKTGFMAAPADSDSLAQAISKYFDSELWRQGRQTREAIRSYANERYSWDKVGTIITQVYSELLERCDCLEGREADEAEVESSV